MLHHRNIRCSFIFCSFFIQKDVGMQRCFCSVTKPQICIVEEITPGEILLITENDQCVYINKIIDKSSSELIIQILSCRF